MLFALITSEEKRVLNASGALFVPTLDAEMQDYSGERRKWKIDDVVSKLQLKMCAHANARREIRPVRIC